jgi:hypothetical protein
MRDTRTGAESADAWSILRLPQLSWGSPGAGAPNLAPKVRFHSVLPDNYPAHAETDTIPRTK